MLKIELQDGLDAVLTAVRLPQDNRIAVFQPERLSLVAERATFIKQNEIVPIAGGVLEAGLHPQHFRPPVRVRQAERSPDERAICEYTSYAIGTSLHSY